MHWLPQIKTMCLSLAVVKFQGAHAHKHINARNSNYTETQINGTYKGCNGYKLKLSEIREENYTE